MVERVIRIGLLVRIISDNRRARALATPERLSGGRGTTEMREDVKAARHQLILFRCRELTWCRKWTGLQVGYQLPGTRKITQLLLFHGWLREFCRSLSESLHRPR